MEASRNIPFFHLMTTDALRKTVRSVELGFFPKEGENNAYWSTGTCIADAPCKKHEGTVPSRSGKKVTKVTQARIFGRLKGI